MFLFGIGKIILADYLTGFIYILIALIAGAVIVKNYEKLGWKIEKSN
jgi:hypothetical protein